MPESVAPGNAHDEIAVTASAQRRRNGLVVVISAPSGTGKTTVSDRLLADMPDLKRSVSFTTRPPRKGENDEKHYHFVSRRQFLEERRAGRFAEWAEVHGHLYGTPRDFLDRQMRNGRDTVLVIDVQGARAVREAIPESVLVFLLPPSLRELEKRLIRRQAGPGDDVGLRLRNAVAEFHCYHRYDYLVVNEDVGKTAKTLTAIIAAERHRVCRIPSDVRKLKRT